MQQFHHIVKIKKYTGINIVSCVRTVLCFFAPHVFCDLVSPSCWLLIWLQVCLVISPLIVCVFKVQSIQFAFVGLWVSSLPVLPWCVTLLDIKDSSFVNSSFLASLLVCEMWHIANECLKHFLFIFFLSKTKYKRDCMSLSTDVAGKEESWGWI